jgi:hypothetical protein
MSLRQAAIEAAAGRLEDNGNHGANWWEMNCHDVSEFVLDEILDYLDDNRNEVAEASYRLEFGSENEGHHDAVTFIRQIALSRLVSALREDAT